MHLLERDELLAALQQSLESAARGDGRVVAIAGEAGAGKSTLVRTFLDAQGDDDVVVRVGACDPLTTPRPLGPLQDVAVEGSALAGAINASAAPATTFPLLLEELRTASAATVLVVEDAHWADASTLDLLRYLARRIVDVRAVVVVTYREEEGGVDHPLRVMLGDLASAGGVDKLVVPPLTREAVETIAAGGGVDAEWLYRLTAGNPFYISEVLAAGSKAVPDRVLDAVLARTARLPGDSRSVLETASVIATRVGLDLLSEAAGEVAGGLDACLVSGMLVIDDGAVRFRHELARRAMESSLSPMRRREIHRNLLRLLSERSAEAATLAHHAEGAGDDEAAVTHGLHAADRAAALGAHREAAAHLASVLRHHHDHASREHAALLDRLSYEDYLTDQIADAITAREQALREWQVLGDVRREGDALRWLSRLYWFVARGGEATEAGRSAVEVLRDEPPGHELAMAYSNLAQLAMLRIDATDADRWGAKALETAQAIDDTEVVVHTLNSLGTVHHVLGDPSGIEELERSLKLALDNDMPEHVARAYLNLMTTSVLTRSVDAASHYAALGIAYCVERDLDAFRWHMTACRGTLALMLDNWDAAVADAEAVVRLKNVSTVTRVIALQVLGRVGTRRGDRRSGALLDEAFDIASATGESQRLVPVAVAHAEAAWLGNRRLRDDVLSATATAMRSHHAWERGELALWLKRLGHPVHAVLPTDLPYALSLAGDHAAAHAAWMARGFRYEAALAAIDGDNVERLRAGADWLVGNGAKGALPRASARLRELGSAALRGPRPSTAANPSQLTQREIEVLALVAEGLADRQIAERLVLSPRTIHHHVAAVLRKLNVTSRHEAGAAAQRIGIEVHSS